MKPGKLVLCVCWLALSGSTSQAAGVLRGYPVQLDGTVEIAPPVVFDIDGDGRLELLIGIRAKLHALEADGNPVAGYPLDFKKGSGLATPVSVGFLGAGKNPAILFGTEDPLLSVLDGSGKSLEGFPVKLPALMAGPPTLGDVDGDGAVDIVFGTRDGKIHVHAADGRRLPGYPASIKSPVSTAVTVGRFGPGESARLFFGDEAGNLHVWSAPGKQQSGFPFKAEFTVSAQPVLGDIDNDGRNEVIFGSKDYKVYALGADGAVLSGFPVSTGYRIYSTCALADLDADGAVDIVVTSGDGKLHAFAKDGRTLAGFPVKAGNRLRASPVVGDLDYDGRLEIAVGSDRSRLVVYRHNGKVYPGFPRKLDDRIEVAPLMADLNGDGLVEVVGVSRAGTITALKMIKKSNKVTGLVWPLEARDAARTGRTYPNPARYVDLAVSPAAPSTTLPLKLSYRFFDLDGDSEPKTVIRWYRNGKHVPGFDGFAEVPATATRKKERWNFTLQAEPEGPVFESPPVRVVNTAPGSPRIAIQPEPGRTRDNLELKIVRESEDADGDKIRYRTTWLRDRKLLKGLTRNTVPAKLTAAGQRWTAVVVPLDGETSGEPARVTMTVVNTPPTAAKFHLKPSRPTVTQDVQVVIESPARDPDGDQVSYLYDWQADGKPLNLSRDTGRLPAGLVAKRSKIRLELTSFDGHQPGLKSEALAEVVNTLPAEPRIRIVPASPATGDDLGVEIIKPSQDPDRDRLTYRVRWTRSGAAYRGAHAEALRLPASETGKGEKWTALVTPQDDEGQGKAARAEVVIRNTPPTAPLVRAKNPRPGTTEDLELEIVKPAQDADGDRTTLDVIWSRGKQELARGQNLLRLPADKTRKKQVIHARLTPSDGQESGTPVEQWFEVQNSIPSGCKVALQPSNLRAGADLTVRVVEASTDPDGDRVQMRYRWYQNGSPVDLKGKAPDRIAGQQIARGQHWSVVATPFDGQAEGPACTAGVTVANTPPTAPVVALLPAKPTTREGLSCKVTSESRDPDRDPVSLKYSWLLDGQPYPTGTATSSIPAGILMKGQTWQVEVVATDGELSSQPATAQVRVENSAPGSPGVVIRPARPKSSDDLYCRLTGPTAEPDGDRLSFIFEWFMLKKGGDQLQGKPLHQHQLLPAARTRKGQNWACRVRASDGMASGAPAMAKVQVANAAPSPPRLKLEPANPGAKQTLQCVIDQPARDPDGDRIAYLFSWTKDGVLQTFAPGTDRVPARLTSENDIWQCSVVATDGKLKSEPVETQEVVIRPMD